jgi:hypothetical protein
LNLEKSPSATDGGFFDRIWSQNSAVAVSGRNWWRHVVSHRRVRRGEATSCGARGYRIKNPGVGPFCPGGVDSLRVNRGSLV